MTEQTEIKDILKEQEETVDAMFGINFLNDENAVFRRTDGGFVSLETNGTFYGRIDCYCAFPHTAPYELISVRDSDGKEIGMIENAEKLSGENREAVKEQISRRYFMPVIKRIESVKEEYGYSYWETVTDRGKCRFTVAAGADTVTRIGENRIFVSDIDGNKFEIEDIRRLKPKELKMIDVFL